MNQVRGGCSGCFFTRATQFLCLIYRLIDIILVVTLFRYCAPPSSGEPNNPVPPCAQSQVEAGYNVCCRSHDCILLCFVRGYYFCCYGFMWCDMMLSWMGGLGIPIQVVGPGGRDADRSCSFWESCHVTCPNDIGLVLTIPSTRDGWDWL